MNRCIPHWSMLFLLILISVISFSGQSYYKYYGSFDKEQVDEWRNLESLPLKASKIECAGACNLTEECLGFGLGYKINEPLSSESHCVLLSTYEDCDECEMEEGIKIYTVYTFNLTLPAESMRSTTSSSIADDVNLSIAEHLTTSTRTTTKAKPSTQMTQTTTQINDAGDIAFSIVSTSTVTVAPPVTKSDSMEELTSIPSITRTTRLNELSGGTSDSTPRFATLPSSEITTKNTGLTMSNNELTISSTLPLSNELGITTINPPTPGIALTNSLETLNGLPPVTQPEETHIHTTATNKPTISSTEADEVETSATVEVEFLPMTSIMTNITSVESDIASTVANEKTSGYVLTTTSIAKETHIDSQRTIMITKANEVENSATVEDEFLTMTPVMTTVPFVTRTTGLALTNENPLRSVSYSTSISKETHTDIQRTTIPTASEVKTDKAEKSTATEAQSLTTEAEFVTVEAESVMTRIPSTTLSKSVMTGFTSTANDIFSTTSKEKTLLDISSTESLPKETHTDFPSSVVLTSATKNTASIQEETSINAPTLAINTVSTTKAEEIHNPATIGSEFLTMESLTTKILSTSNDIASTISNEKTITTAFHPTSDSAFSTTITENPKDCTSYHIRSGNGKHMTGIETDSSNVFQVPSIVLLEEVGEVTNIKEVPLIINANVFDGSCEDEDVLKDFMVCTQVYDGIVQIEKASLFCGNPPPGVQIDIIDPEKVVSGNNKAKCSERQYITRMIFTNESSGVKVEIYCVKVKNQ